MARMEDVVRVRHHITYNPRRDLALRYAEGSAPKAPTAKRAEIQRAARTQNWIKLAGKGVEVAMSTTPPSSERVVKQSCLIIEVWMSTRIREPFESALWLRMRPYGSTRASMPAQNCVGARLCFSGITHATSFIEPIGHISGFRIYDFSGLTLSGNA